MKVMTLWGEEEYSDTRICSECKVEKPISKFAMDTTYLRSKCKECKSSHNNQLNQLRKQYPKPDSDYACPVCGDTIETMKEKGYKRLNWCLDHNHITGQYRGYLCHLCNTGISNLRDDVNIMRKAIDYLVAETKPTASHHFP